MHAIEFQKAKAFQQYGKEKPPRWCIGMERLLRIDLYDNSNSSSSSCQDSNDVKFFYYFFILRNTILCWLKVKWENFCMQLILTKDMRDDDDDDDDVEGKESHYMRMEWKKKFIIIYDIWDRHCSYSGVFYALLKWFSPLITFSLHSMRIFKIQKKFHFHFMRRKLFPFLSHSLTHSIYLYSYIGSQKLTLIHNPWTNVCKQQQLCEWCQNTRENLHTKKGENTNHEDFIKWVREEKENSMHSKRVWAYQEEKREKNIISMFNV